MTFGLEPRHIDALLGVLREFPGIDRAAVFGSRARGDHRPGSDLDLALWGESLTLRDEGRLASRIEDLNLPVEVDLVRVSTVDSAALRAEIDRDAVDLLVHAPAG